MKNKIAGALALTACAGLAQAQSNLTLYGNFDEYIGYIRSSNGSHITGLNDGAILRTRLGVRGSEALRAGYEIKYTLEMGINADTGAAADSSRLFDRQSWVGLNTPAGEVRVGRQNTEIFLTGGAIDYTERTTFGSVINTFGIPSRYDNDISYRSPRVAGLMLSLHYALAENGGAARGNRPIYQAALDFERGPYRFGYAGLQAAPNQLTATVREKVNYHHVYTNYKYGAGTIYIAFVRSNNSTANANGRNAGAILNNISVPNNYFAGTDLNAERYYNIWQVSADYRVTPALRVGALYGAMRDTSGGDAGTRGANVGAYYTMSKRTSLYSFLSYLKNDTNAGFRFSSSAGPSANLAGDAINGRTLTGLQLGILHRF
ncbi:MULTISPECIES: porin [unclassified Massilia]|uniref:porin n=1 Tax=unclassified Massilia TaxID=2609279 RepID=UPI00177C4D66|nr:MULTISPECIES: porin [unclassified Massilia]MBD8532919.1 porin [Massilia sp. CFBP 13647]MBD8676317.1 porin [Massilia sp. CFBP 13721]